MEDDEPGERHHHHRLDAERDRRNDHGRGRMSSEEEGRRSVMRAAKSRGRRRGVRCWPRPPRATRRSSDDERRPSRRETRSRERGRRGGDSSRCRRNRLRTARAIPKGVRSRASRRGGRDRARRNLHQARSRARRRPRRRRTPRSVRRRGRRARLQGSGRLFLTPPRPKLVHRPRDFDRFLGPRRRAGGPRAPAGSRGDAPIRPRI